jgi:hypothetical protein
MKILWEKDSWTINWYSCKYFKFDDKKSCFIRKIKNLYYILIIQMTL